MRNEQLQPLHHLPLSTPATSQRHAISTVPDVAQNLLRRLADPSQGAPAALAFLSIQAAQRGPGWTQQALPPLLDWLAEPSIRTAPSALLTSAPHHHRGPGAQDAKGAATLNSFPRTEGISGCGNVPLGPSCLRGGLDLAPRALNFPQLLQLQLRQLLSALPRCPNLYDSLDEHRRRLLEELLAALPQDPLAARVAAGTAELSACATDGRGHGSTSRCQRIGSAKRYGGVEAWMQSAMTASRLRYQRPQSAVLPPLPSPRRGTDAVAPLGSDTRRGGAFDAKKAGDGAGVGLYSAVDDDAGGADTGWWWIPSLDLKSNNMDQIQLPPGLVTKGAMVVDEESGAAPAASAAVPAAPASPRGRAGGRNMAGVRGLECRLGEPPRRAGLLDKGTDGSRGEEGVDAGDTAGGDMEGDEEEEERGGEAGATGGSWQEDRAHAATPGRHRDADASPPRPAKRLREGAAAGAALAAAPLGCGSGGGGGGEGTAASLPTFAEVLRVIQDTVSGGGQAAPPETWRRLEALLEQCAASGLPYNSDAPGTVLPADAVLLLVRHLATPRLSGAAARLLLSAVVYPAVVAVERVMPRPLQEALTAAGGPHPRPLAESVLVPAVQRPQLSPGQAQLLVKATTGAGGRPLPQPLQALVLRAAASVAAQWSEPHLAVVQGLVDGAKEGEGLDLDTLELLCRGLCAAVTEVHQAPAAPPRPRPLSAASMSRSVPLCRLMLSVTSRCGGALGVAQLRLLASAAAATSTFLTKPCLAKLQELMTSAAGE